MARASKPSVNALTVHQVIAHNVFQARTLRRWTQQQAADAISEALGKPLTGAGLSAIEKTFSSRRQRVFDVTELVAFARAFGVPVAWFFLPPSGRETDPIPPLYEHAATMAVDVFGDEDAWQWYIARIIVLIGYPRSILHDELLGSGGYPGVDEWAAIDDKREQLLNTALDQFGSEHSELIEQLLANLTKLKHLTTTGHASTHRAEPSNDSFGRIVNRVPVERVNNVERIQLSEQPPQPSPRYQRRTPARTAPGSNQR